MTPTRRVVHVKPNRIPELRRILPFIDQPRLRPPHQFGYVDSRLREITVASYRIRHVQNAFCMLFACRSLATPFRTFHKDSTCPGKLPFQNSI